MAHPGPRRSEPSVWEKRMFRSLNLSPSALDPPSCLSEVRSNLLNMRYCSMNTGLLLQDGSLNGQRRRPHDRLHLRVL